MITIPFNALKSLLLAPEHKVNGFNKVIVTHKHNLPPPKPQLAWQFSLRSLTHKLFSSSQLNTMVTCCF